MGPGNCGDDSGLKGWGIKESDDSEGWACMLSCGQLWRSVWGLAVAAHILCMAVLSAAAPGPVVLKRGHKGVSGDTSPGEQACLSVAASAMSSTGGPCDGREDIEKMRSRMRGASFSDTVLAPPPALPLNRWPLRACSGPRLLSDVSVASRPCGALSLGMFPTSHASSTSSEMAGRE